MARTKVGIWSPHVGPLGSAQAPPTISVAYFWEIFEMFFGNFLAYFWAPGRAQGPPKWAQGPWGSI